VTGVRPGVGAALIAAALATAGCADGDAPGSAGEPPPGGLAGTVSRVVDGDTIHVRAGGERTIVRLVGIDTPEVHPEEECFGDEAADLTRGLLPPGTTVAVRTDPTQGGRDRFGRMLGYVYTGSASGPDSVNNTLVRAGAARVFLRVRDPFTHAGAFLASERAAKRAERGVWGPACRR
jgi:micrococcal nuclease